MSVSKGIIAAMATIPSRRNKLRKVINSLLVQVDAVHVYMNGYDKAPEWMKKNDRIKFVLSNNTQYKDVGDAGKFFWCEIHDGIYLTVDDDLIYPPTYVDQMMEGLRSVGNRAIITMHGATINRGARAYHTGKKLYALLSNQNKSRNVHIGGTGCMAFDTALIRPMMSWFPTPNMADVWIGKKAQQTKTPILMIPHNGAEFTLINYKKTIWAATSSKDGSEMDASEVSDKIIRETDWRLPPIVGR